MPRSNSRSTRYRHYVLTYACALSEAWSRRERTTSDASAGPLLEKKIKTPITDHRSRRLAGDRNSHYSTRHRRRCDDVRRTAFSLDRNNSSAIFGDPSASAWPRSNVHARSLFKVHTGWHRSANAARRPVFIANVARNAPIYSLSPIPIGRPARTETK